MEEAVTKYLAEIHINVKLNWLRAVIMFAKSHGVANEVALCHAVFEQLLYSNLSDSYEPLTKVPVVAMKAVIVKQMIFQVVSIINVARSCYEQYCEYVEEGDGLSWFHGDEEDINQPQQLSPHRQLRESSGCRRMLKIKLFDGENTVHAIEYGGELALDENTIQGTKILLTERVLLRRGILLLNPSNCQVLNGDIEAVRLNNKLLFAERLGIKNNMKSQRSTISPYMIRVPRISNQLLHTSDTKAKNANDKLEVKAQINDSEKTAVVPPIQNNLTPTATVPPLYNDVPQGTLITELTYAPPVIQKKLLLPLQRDVKSKPQSDHTEDLPIFVTDPQLILYDGKKASSISHKKSTNSSRNKSIMEYFPVSRNQRMTEQTAEGKCSSSHSVHPVPTVPLSQQRLVVVVDKNDHVVGTEFCERARIQNEVLPIQHLATSSLDTTNVSSHCNSSSNHNFTTKDGVGMNKEVLEEEEPVVITTQELINSSVPESSSFQNNSDLMSFIESSLPCRSNVEKSRPLVNPQWMDDVTSTAVIPYKRGRINNERRGSPYETSVMDRFHELRLVYVSQAFSHRKFWMLPKVVRVMGICHIKDELVAKHGSWLLDVYITDESINYQKCSVDGQLLESMLGFSVRHCEVKMLSQHSLRNYDQRY